MGVGVHGLDTRLSKGTWWWRPVKRPLSCRGAGWRLCLRVNCDSRGEGSGGLLCGIPRGHGLGVS